MRIGFYSWDEVNCFLAGELAASARLEAVSFYPKEGPPDSHEMPSVIDLDCLAPTAAERRRLVKELSARPLRRPVAVFGYNLDDEDVDRLEANGVFVRRRLDSEFFVEFARRL